MKSTVRAMRPPAALLILLMAALLATSPAAARLDPRSLSTWADAELGEAVREGRVSAATMVVVQGGRPVLQRTYGYADASAGLPVGPPRERFIIASVTKTFTATAIALLVQDGRIKSLDDRANVYLKRVQLPGAFGQAITLRHLLTHSAGFEERGFAIGDRSDRTVPVSADYVRAHLPAIVRAPGSRIVYANIDPAILGLVVEDVTGLTMRDFIHRRILTPLGMKDTELVYDAAASARLVRPHFGPRAGAFDINTPFHAPTGSIHTTADDMGRFLLAQLGYFPDVLSPATVASLHRPLARNAPTLDPIGMAFFLSGWNGYKVVGHSGAFSGFGSDLYFVPEQDFGIFYSWAGGPAPGAGSPLEPGKLQASFLNLALGPYRAPPPLAVQPDPTHHVGRYWQERRPQTNFEAIVAANAVVEVARASANRLTINGDGPYYSFAPGSYTIARDGKPGPVYVFGANSLSQRAGAARRVSGLSDPRNQLMFGAAALGLLLTGLLGPLWMRGRAKLLALLIGVLAGGVPLLLFVIPPGLEQDIIAGRYARFLALKLNIVLLIGLAACLGWLTWRGDRRGMAQWHSALLGAAALALLVPFTFFNLL
ncbi:serine hydrolase domain-containing protein [Sphingosinicella rhizophila]|uniref:Serine hydrolase domain-containing protein n=1 Tax=Sphingosinicella rhizophila TaxID=3050082 RepID=A0ABU3QC49_9SPHN|nr:serine hydrolase domain-containing protein [Sphingosinicella sp. GR2756]MDT9600520.1 serine hydrolase domain-containing protein [Sphingosinicella sp. GR2756]